jgi:Proteasome subunit
MVGPIMIVAIHCCFSFSLSIEPLAHCRFAGCTLEGRLQISNGKGDFDSRHNQSRISSTPEKIVAIPLASTLQNQKSYSGHNNCSVVIIKLSTVSLHYSNSHFIANSTMGDAEYSFSLTTFSRTGKLLPLEYALNAVANGRTVIGIACRNGVVLVTDKTVPSTLCDAAHVHKIEPITESTGVCFSGLGPDYRVLGKWRMARPSTL